MEAEAYCTNRYIIVLNMRVSDVFALVATTTTILLLLDAQFCSAFRTDGDIPSPRIAKTTNSILTNIDAQILEQYAIFANQLADAAREEILPYWRCQNKDALGQQIKLEESRSVFQSASPVTLADRAAERAMRGLITSKFPSHGIYGEEYGIKDADADWVW